MHRKLEYAFKKVLRDDIWSEQKYQCCYCGVKLKRTEATLDHVTPKSKGGTNMRENLRVACRPCNQRKDSKPVEVYESEEELHFQKLVNGMCERIRERGNLALWRMSLDTKGSYKKWIAYQQKHGLL